MEATGAGSCFFSGISHIVCLEDFCILVELMFGFEAEVTDVLFCLLELDSPFKDGFNKDFSDRGSGNC